MDIVGILLVILNYMPYVAAAIGLMCVYIIAHLFYDAYKQLNKTGFWHLYLDDERNLPSHYDRERRWYVCRSSEEAKQMVKRYGIPQFMSLDHDLGGDDTTMKFLHWLAEEYFFDQDKNPGGEYLIIPGYVIHSQNPVGAENIKSYMESWKKAYKTTVK